MVRNFLRNVFSSVSFTHIHQGYLVGTDLILPSLIREATMKNRSKSQGSYMRPANERRRYNVTSSLIGWAHTENDPCLK